MRQQLSLSARPRTLDELIGQAHVVQGIKGLSKQSSTKGWLLSGPKGCGKTTIARILALSYQCKHQDFGNPCLQCRKNASSFSIYRIDGATLTGKKEIQEALNGSYYGPLTGSRARVYILDEVHRCSPEAHDLLLSQTEDTPVTTHFILCSTQPYKIAETLRSRCQWYELHELDRTDTEVLIQKLLNKIGSDKSAEHLADILAEKGIGSPRLICQAVEKYSAGESPELASEVAGSTSIDVRDLSRCVVRGDWDGVSRILMNSQKQDVRGARLSLIAYLRAILLKEPEFNDRGKSIAKAINMLAQIQNAEDIVIAAVLSSVLYDVTSIFSKYKLG